jgi:hypothetical protein
MQLVLVVLAQELAVTEAQEVAQLLQEPIRLLAEMGLLELLVHQQIMAVMVVWLETLVIQAVLALLTLSIGSRRQK